MTDERVHAFLQALHSGDAARIQAVLAIDATVSSPILADPIRGSDRAAKVLTLIASVVDNLSFGEVLAGERHSAVHLTGEIDNTKIEAIDYLQFDHEGRVSSMTVMARPLPAVVALQNRLAPAIGMPPVQLVPADDPVTKTH